MKITIENGLKSGVIVKTRVISIVSNPIKVVVVVVVIFGVALVKKMIKTKNFLIPKQLRSKKNLRSTNFGESTFRIWSKLSL